jgi:signal transduction histidine kinase
MPLGWWAVIGLGVAAAIVAAVPALRREFLVATRRALMSRAEREAAIDALVKELARAGHGKLKATTTFRRLREQLALLSSHEGEPPPGFDERFRQAVANAREIGIGNIRKIAESAAELGLGGRAAPALVRDLDGLAKLIGRLSGAPPDGPIASTLRRQLDQLLPPITEGLERIGYEARLARSCSLGAEVSRVADSWGDECRRRGIMLDAPDASRYRDTRVLVTSQELTFILDNLIDNAVRAVGGRERPRIAVSIETDELTAVIAVADNGSGVAAERQEEIFRSGVSEKPGGGSGLPTSREILEKRGGRLRLVRSAPGEGTVFEVRLLIVRPPSAGGVQAR